MDNMVVTAAKMVQSEEKKSVVLVLDFGSQYTHLITRRIRSLNICSFCLPAGTPMPAIQALHPALIILSGGPHSVHIEGSPTVPEGFFEYVKENGITVLGICYGLHLIVKLLGGTVTQAESQEYGRMEITAVKGSRLYGDADSFPNQTVWMSHGDEAVKLPPGFSVVATSLQGNIAAIENAEANIYALQYHPEVTFYCKPSLIMFINVVEFVRVLRLQGFKALLQFVRVWRFESCFLGAGVLNLLCVVAMSAQEEMVSSWHAFRREECKIEFKE